MAQTFKLNVKANIANMSAKSKFRKPSPDSIMIYRLAPSVTEDGIIFYRVRQAWKLQDQDGNNIALADLAVHGNDKTGREDYVMEFSKVLMAADSKMLQDIGTAVRANNIFHAQGFEVEKQTDGSLKYEQNLSLLSIPKTAAEAILEIVQRQQFMNEPTLEDIEGGQPVLLTRTGKGFDTKYSAERSGQVLDLNIAVPGFQDKLEEDVLGSVNLKIYTREMQKQIVRMSYPDLDWDKLEGEMGL